MTSAPPVSAGWFAPPGPRVLAHRGLAVEAPENTMLAFALAVSAGATYVETDVHATRDGIAIISHDPDLRRLAGRDQRLLDLDLADVKTVRLDGEHEIPTLDEALDAFPETRFNVDLKSDEAVAPAVRAIKRVRATDRVLVTSFDHRRRLRAVAALPGVATSASSRGITAAVAAGLVPVAGLRRALLRRALAGCGAVQVPERKGPVRIVTASRVAEFAALGVETHVWTVNEPAVMARLLALGVHGIVSDRADLALVEVGRLAI
ncbi:glycerophosphodiester phosphodiesterase family protein [Frigoribacterium sp. VKM Ac-1396]|uniref:glycerophosphodiester phosphodiesterase family protein n=1 Tax=Frigoribacterium sp. VKM Ac-1396 TaxID=2783821 RepID=UPI00351C52BF